MTNKIKRNVVAALAFGIALNSGSAVADGLSIQRMLEITASEMQSMLPLEMDESTVLDRVEALPDNRLFYGYTLTLGSQNAGPDFSQFMYRATKRLVTESWCVDSDMTGLLALGVTGVYLYRNEAGAYLFHFEVTEGDCK